jgi:hypothetical protein
MYLPHKPQSKKLLSHENKIEASTLLDHLHDHNNRLVSSYFIDLLKKHHHGNFPQFSVTCMYGNLIPIIHIVHLVTCKGQIINYIFNFQLIIESIFKMTLVIWTYMNLTIIHFKLSDQCILGFSKHPKERVQNLFIFILYHRLTPLQKLN